jgi:hypothetical protein
MNLKSDIQTVNANKINTKQVIMWIYTSTPPYTFMA